MLSKDTRRGTGLTVVFDPNGRRVCIVWPAATPIN